jgi:uncharacterized protein (DUF58 family)
VTSQHAAEVLAGRLPPLLVAAERLAATVHHGVHGRRRAGPGGSFWQFRRHQPGDSASAIDWRRSARTDHLFTREREWVAAQAVWLWRDGSPSMDFGDPSKRERAELLILALAALLARGGERVALLGTGESPTAGRDTVARLLPRLRPGGEGLPGFESLPRHARLVWVGDFLSPLDAVAERVAAFARAGLRGHLVQVLAGAEETLPYAGRVLFEGPEGEGVLLAGRAEDLRGDYVAALARHREGLKALAAGWGWTFAAHRTDQAPETALLGLHQVLAA